MDCRRSLKKVNPSRLIITAAIWPAELSSALCELFLGQRYISYIKLILNKGQL